MNKLRGFSQLRKLCTRARRLPDPSRFKLLKILKEEEEDLIKYNDWWREIIRDAKQIVETFEGFIGEI